MGLRLVCVVFATTIIACGSSNKTIECTSANHCVLVDGEAKCEDGYVWEDATNPDNLHCVPIESGDCNSSLTCETLDARRCTDDNVEVCQVVSDCLQWQVVQTCEAPQSCSQGYCTLVCDEECDAIGARTCSDVSSYQICGAHDADPCLEWGAAMDCTGSATCLDGYCQIACEPACTGDEICVDGSCNLPPVADLRCPSRIVIGNAATIDASPSTDADGSVVGFSFAFGDTTTSAGTASVVLHTYESLDLYTVTVTVQDDDGSTDQASCDIEVIEGIDPCDVMTCDLAPAPICHTSTTRRVFQTPGTCTAGYCDFPYTDEPCAELCAGGECISVSCTAGNCVSAPPDACSDSHRLLVYPPVGSCVSDECIYASSEYFCADGCAGGNCAPGSLMHSMMDYTTSYQRTGIVLDSHDAPHVAYTAGDDLFVASYLPTGWSRVAVDLSIGDRAVFLAIDPSDQLHLTYHDSNRNVRYATGPGGGPFDVEFVESLDTAESGAILVNPSGVPYVAFHNVTDETVELVRRGPSGWRVERTVAVAGPRAAMKMAFDGSLEPIIAYSGYDSVSEVIEETNVGLPDVSGTWSIYPVTERPGVLSGLVHLPATGEVVLLLHYNYYYLLRGVPGDTLTWQSLGSSFGSRRAEGDLNIDASGVLHLVYSNNGYSDDTLMHAWLDPSGGDWQSEELLGGRYWGLATAHDDTRVHISGMATSIVWYIRPFD